MRVPAIVFHGAGGAEVISVGETEVREPGRGEVQVVISAAGVNRADVLQRRGLYPAPPGVPVDVPGLEFSGTVAVLGPGATRWTVGCEVMGITGGGAMAQRITVHERELVPVPRGVGLIEAAAIPEVFFTAWDALIVQAELGPGENALVHAAASGVGTAAIQVIRAIGARPIATGRQADKLAKLTALGLVPHDAITVDGPRFAAAVGERTHGRGAEVILDCVGGAYFEENLRALASRGRLVLIGSLGGTAPVPVPLAMMLGKRAKVIGTVLRARPLEEKIALAQDVTARLVPLFERGLVHPVIDEIMPMADIARAHARMEANANIGKLVLTW
jgi:putative PIG3 family NAD(P)H quinone oxidoreductase